MLTKMSDIWLSDRVILIQVRVAVWGCVGELQALTAAHGERE